MTDSFECMTVLSTWQFQETCPGSCEPPGHCLDGLSAPENPYLHPWHIAVAQSNQKLYIQGVTRVTRVYGHVAHLGMV